MSSVPGRVRGRLERRGRAGRPRRIDRAVLPVLESLDQASLVQQQTVADETRFLMLETIREFALEQLTRCGEAAAAYDPAMLEYYARFSKRQMSSCYVRRHHAGGRGSPPSRTIYGLPFAGRWNTRHIRARCELRRGSGASIGWPACSVKVSNGWKLRWQYREQAPLELQANALRAAGIACCRLE